MTSWRPHYSMELSPLAKNTRGLAIDCMPLHIFGFRLRSYWEATIHEDVPSPRNLASKLRGDRPLLKKSGALP